jgi:D-alanyl-lipoteichoic acid acyltransferase DltB (MBOAT superfamily)|tara:strand:+ start:2904 stop:3062 length:159 start_codon:yes stop_codon:yes gene_type:complete
MAKVPEELANKMRESYLVRQDEKKAKKKLKIIYIGGAVVILGIVSYFIFKKK